MTQFMTEAHPDAFVDFPEKRGQDPRHSDYVECPVCKGHGGWNLELNAYPKDAEAERRIREQLKRQPFMNMPGHDMTHAQFRHYYVHFRASCSQCNGWGQVPPDEADHEHFWTERNVGKCLHEWTCTVCGKKQVVDSSD